jgi:hypothetical protein
MGNTFCWPGVGSGGAADAGACLRGVGPGFGTLFGLDDLFMVGILITVGGLLLYKTGTWRSHGILQEGASAF